MLLCSGVSHKEFECLLCVHTAHWGNIMYRSVISGLNNLIQNKLCHICLSNFREVIAYDYIWRNFQVNYNQSPSHIVFLRCKENCPLETFFAQADLHTVALSFICQSFFFISIFMLLKGHLPFHYLRQC